MIKRLAPVLDFLFPCYCVSCGTPVLSYENHLCGRCRKTFKFAGAGCKVCSSINQGEECGFCSERKFYPSKHVSLFEYDGAAKKVVYALKFGGIRGVYRVFIPFMVESLKRFDCGIDLITYVPVNRRKKSSRGYNQTELLASALSEAAGIPCRTLLREKGDSTPQREFSSSSRYINVIDRYETIRNCNIKDRTILLIDDVFTTGATINECSRQLLISGACKVFSLTVARSDLKKLENI